MKTIQLGTSDLHVTPICLGTMTFGEQVDEATSHAILSRALERGVTFWDTAEMYAVPPRAETFQVTETYIGNWIAKNPHLRQQLTIATKVAGPSRGMPWVRGGSMDLTAADIVAACDGSLQRLNTDVIDLYQLHWPTRNLPLFGMMAFDPSKDRVVTSMHTQLEALGQLVKAGKVRAIGLSNESPYGMCEFVHLAEQHGLPRVATVQNAYSLLNRTHENGMDEAMHPLTLLTFGMYGEVLPNQNGAPIRLNVPWKYGFKNAKSIVKIRFTDKQPATAWNKAAANEYGFYSNVNPNVDHPRWSQATERRIGEDGLFNKKRKTLMFNGYEAQVASLYSGLDLSKNF